MNFHSQVAGMERKYGAARVSPSTKSLKIMTRETCMEILNDRKMREREIFQAKAVVGFK